MLTIGDKLVLILPRPKKNRSGYPALIVLQKALVNFIEEETHLLPANMKNNGNLNLARVLLGKTDYQAEEAWCNRYGYKNPYHKDKDLTDEDLSGDEIA
jgi:hypothetical protein